MVLGEWRYRNEFCFYTAKNIIRIQICLRSLLSVAAYMLQIISRNLSTIMLLVDKIVQYFTVALVSFIV